MPDRLSVLHLAHVRWFNAEAQYALDLAEGMSRLGHRVTYLTQTGSPAARQARARGVETVEAWGRNGNGPLAALAAPAALRLGRLLRRAGADALEVHRPEGLLPIALAARAAGIPVIRIRGDMRPVRSDPLNRYLYRRILSAVVASNSAVERGLRERIGRIPNLLTIHGGVDPEVFSPQGPTNDVRPALGFPPGSFLVGILGRLSEIKGHYDFLAAARLASEGTRAFFVILNKEPVDREEELRRAVAADPVLRGRVGFLGHRADLPAVLRSFDLGVVASTASEANCRVGLEWMASGVPLVATTIGVLPDLVLPGRTGLLVPPGDPGALAEAISALARAPEEARRLGAAGRARVCERFTVDRCARAHEELIRRVRAAARSAA